MKRKPIVVAIATLATTAAFAQAGPDFSPVPPRNLDTLGSQAQDAPYATQSAPATDLGAPPPVTPNPSLSGYESSAPPLPADAVVVEPRYDAVIVPARPVAPRQSIIGDGLFNRRGPNDFGA